MNTIEFRDKLVAEIAKIDCVKGIAQTGDLNEELIPGKSDIDLFVLCDRKIPSEKERRNVYECLERFCSECRMSVCNGGIWGYGDILIVNDIDVMPMYFTIEEMDQYISEVLKGERLGKEGRFYPTGRLASVETINILYEKGSVWSQLKTKVKSYPEKLFQDLFAYHISCVLDEEDLGRVVLRKELLFYHQVLEDAMDHLLQAIFALNHCYFPSRKKTKKYLESFSRVPENCYVKLETIIQKSTKIETIEESVQELRSVTEDIMNLSIYTV